MHFYLHVGIIASQQTQRDIHDAMTADLNSHSLLLFVLHPPMHETRETVIPYRLLCYITSNQNA